MRTTATIRLDQPMTDAAELARRAEALGYDGVWVADHYFHRDASGALALMAAATTDITLGTAVTSPLLRHPALLASMAASLGEISGGRFILGLGAGGYEFATELGTPIQRPLALTEEAVQVVRGLAEGSVTTAGDSFSTNAAALKFHAPAPPIYLAARGPKMLSLAGRISDGVITHGLSPEHVRFVIERLQSGAAGARPRVVLMLDVQLDDDRARALDALRPRCLTMAGGSYADELIEIYGLDRAHVELLRVAVRSGDRDAATALVTDEMVDAFTLAGPADLVAERLTELADLGVDEVILSTAAGGLEDTTTSLTELAKAAIR